MIKDINMYDSKIFRKCDGNRSTTRNVLDIKQGQIILVRRGFTDNYTETLVSFISQLTPNKSRTKN